LSVFFKEFVNATSISPPHIFFNSILVSRTSGTPVRSAGGFGFAPIAQADTQAKAKEPFFAYALMTTMQL
jgi:hypothetical protein